MDRIEVFKQMLEGEPDNTQVLFGLANDYFKAEQYTNAIPVFEKYLSYETDEGAAYGMLARCYETIGEREKARETYSKGIEIALQNGHPSMAESFRQTLEFDYENP